MLYLNFILVDNKVSHSVEIPSWIRYIDNIHTLSENIKFIYTSFRNGKKREHLTSLSYLASSAVDRGFEPQSGHTKDYEIGICCFSTKHTKERGKRKRKDWLDRNQNNVVEWSDMSTRGRLFQ